MSPIADNTILQEALPLKHNKENKTFMILSALGIIFVLDDHTGMALHLFSNIFPYDSFFMPLFVFVSGYFFKPEQVDRLPKYIFKKMRTFLLPYLVYNLFYLVLTIFIGKIIPISWPYTIKKFLISCWSYGTPVDLSSSGWFVIMLFHVVCVYAILRKLFKRYWNNLIATLLFIGVGSIAVYISHNGYCEERNILLVKIAFFLQFYQLGVCYKTFFEKKLQKVSDMYIILFSITINIILTCLYGTNISFVRCAFMEGFLTENYLLPTITSITGILFWITIAKKLSLIWGGDTLINFISNNTFFIMFNHLFLFNIFNIILWLLNYNAFDKKTFLSTAWYQARSIPQFGVFYLIFCIFVTWIIKVTEYKLKKTLTK